MPVGTWMPTGSRAARGSSPSTTRSPAPPALSRSYVAVFRNDDRVWRQRLTKSAFTVLSSLAAGEPLGESLGKAKAGEPVAEWFQGFAATGLFVAVDFS